MTEPDVVLQASPTEVLNGMVEKQLSGVTLLCPAQGPTLRRLLYVDNYGGKLVWEKIKSGDMPPHHLRGCLQLVRKGYEVALPEPLPDFYLHRNPFPHDLRLLPLVRNWLGKDGVIFCGHNVLYWLLFLKKFRLLSCKIVSNIWANEPLNFASAHSGIAALTRAGLKQANKLAPRVKAAPLGWGADLSVYPRLPYRPEMFFSCGIALRDFKTISLAAAKTTAKFQVICPGDIEGLNWPSNVGAINSGRGWNFQAKRVSYSQLLHNYYARSAASLIILKKDPAEYTAVGFTEVVEAMAMARPVIMTRTGALPSEIDIEKHGAGLFVPPEDPEALANAINYIADHPDKARIMGEHARRLAESRYNMERYAGDLHNFFNSL